jgi:hypothetical protein
MSKADYIFNNHAQALFALKDYSKELEAKLAKFEWQPIETAPKDGEEFLAMNTRQGNVKRLVSWNTIHGFWQSKGDAINMQETHWMPLLEAPKQ